MPFSLRRPGAADTLRRLCGWALLAALALGASAPGLAGDTEAPAPARPHRVLESLYARYMAGGRGDVEVHLSTDGLRASARSLDHGNGTYSCHVYGLRPPGGDYDSPHAVLMLAGTLVHEATHCQVTPYAIELRRSDDDPVSGAIDTYVLLALESISDARAVIELARKDGLEAAQAFTALMLPRRISVDHVGHATAAALRDALALVTERPGHVRGDEQAFAAALRIGREAARHTFNQFVEATGQVAVTHDPAFAQAGARLDQALRRALQAFRTGRYENNAATLRVSEAATSAGDYHFFVGPDGSTRSEPVVGAEGVRHAASLKALMQADRSVEQGLALRWLRREGTLDETTLSQTRRGLARLLQAFSGSDAARRERAAEIVRRCIDRSRRGEGLSALLERVSDELRSLSG